MESFSTDSVTPAQLVTELIQTSGLLVLVLANRLGSKDGQSGKYFVELEYQAAKAAGVSIHVFLSSSNRLVTEYESSISRTEQGRLSKLRKHLQATHTVRTWRTASELTHEVFVSLSQRRSVRRDIDAVKHQPSYDTIPTTAPLSPIADYTSIVEWYELNLSHFDQQRERLEKELRVTLVRMLRSGKLADFTVYSRTKSAHSLSGKLERPKRGETFTSPADVHDLIGLRVVLLHEAEVEQVSQDLRRQLTGAKLEVKRPSDPLSFGYRSHHITADVNQAIAEKSGFRYEIQVRTLLQHTWAQIEHRLGYKSTMYDDESRRVFAQVSALLEIADDKFSQLKARQENGIETAHTQASESAPLPSSRQSIVPAPTLTEQTIQNYFLGDLWDSSQVLAQVLSYGLAFSVDISNTKARSQDLAELLVFLRSCGIVSLEALHQHLVKDADHLSELIKDLQVRIEFSEVTPLLLLWLLALTARAAQLPQQANAEVRALLDHFNLFLEEDRDAIADLISVRPYLS